MVSFRHFQLFGVLLLVSVAASTLSATTVFSVPLPTTNLNSGAGANRTNGSVIEGILPSNSQAFIVGDDFTPSTSAVINSVTVWTVLGTPIVSTAATPDAELSQVTLYGGQDSTQLATLGTLNSTQLASAARAYYTGTTSYESLNVNGTFYPIYALTFTGLNWSVTAGTMYDFAVGGTALSGKSFALSISTIDPAVLDTMDIFQGTPPQFYRGTSNNFVTNFAQYAAVNVLMDGTLTGVPEPSTLCFLALGIGAIVLKLRRR